MFCHLESSASAHVTVTREDKYHNHEHPYFPRAFIAEHSVTRDGIALRSVQVHGPAVCPPSLLCTPSLRVGGAECKKETTSRLCDHCSATARTRVCYQHWFSHKFETQHYTGYYEEC